MINDVLRCGVGGASVRGGGGCRLEGRCGTGFVLATRHGSLHNTGVRLGTKGGRRRRVVGSGRALVQTGCVLAQSTNTKVARRPASVEPAGGPSGPTTNGGATSPPARAR